ncbi:MAG: hypothetical protein C0624_04425 [Desulfuromonas sp.]|nr:MAG: hypothetical protein C0624_04425 [Desulfuromonas sp.]
MVKRTKIAFFVFLGVYLLGVAVTAMALIVTSRPPGEPPRFHSVEVARNAFGRLGLKVAGQGVSADLKLMLLADTISSDRLLATSLDRGYMFDVEVAGDYLMVARASYGLEVYNRHRKPILAVEAHLDLGGRVVDLEVAGDTLYALLSDPGKLVKISIKDPLRPVILKELELSGAPLELMVLEQALYVADVKQGLWQVSPDLEVLASPEQFAGLDCGWKLAASGDYLFVTALDGRIWSLEVSQGWTRSKLVATLADRVTGFDGDRSGLQVQYQGGQLQFFHVTPDGYLKATTATSLSTSKLHAHGAGVYLEREGRLLVVSDASRGATIYHRDSVGALTPQGNVLQAGIFSSVAVADDVLYATSSRGLTSWSLEDLPINSATAASVVALAHAYSFDRLDNFLIARSQLNNNDFFNFQLLGLEQKGQLAKMHSIDDPLGVAVSDNHLWVANGSDKLEGFHVLSDGTLEPCWQTSGHAGLKHMASFGDHVLLSVNQEVLIYASAAHSEPKLLARLPVQERIADFLLDDNYVYVTLEVGGEVVVFDWSIEGGPKVVSRYRLPDPLREFALTRRMCKYKNRLFVSLGNAGLLALDVSEPTDIRQSFYLDTPGFSSYLREYDGVLYVADHFSGVRLIDLEKIDETGVPRVIGSFQTAFDPHDTALIDGDLYVAGGVRGTVRMPAPMRLAPESIDGGEAFVPLPRDYHPGRYRLLAYSAAGHLVENMLVTIPSLN